MLDAQDLAARRGEATLFSGVNFALARGTALIVTGANGSGKTTLLRIAAGLTRPEHGSLAWNGGTVRGFDPALRAAALFIGDLPALKDELTTEENLVSLATLHGEQADADTVRGALAALSLTSQRHLPARVLSQGQRRRIGLARLYLHRRPLWLLDEPATALDAAGITTLQGLLAGHLAGGGVAIIATHQELGLATSTVDTLRLS